MARTADLARTATRGSQAAGASPVVVPVAARVSLPRGRHRPVLWVVGVALLAAGTLSVVWLVDYLGHTVPVVVAARDIPAGTAITEADLAIAQVAAAPGVATIPAVHRDALVGRMASGDVPAGAVLAQRQFTEFGPPAAGQVLVPLSLPVSRVPLEPLRAGDRVLVVDTPPADADPPTVLPGSIPAEIEHVGRPDVNGVVVIDVSVAAGDGPALAARSATGRIALVLQPRARAAG